MGARRARARRFRCARDVLLGLAFVGLVGAGIGACTAAPEAQTWSYRSWTDASAARLGSGGARWFVGSVRGGPDAAGESERVARTRASRADIAVWFTTSPPRDDARDAARRLASELEREYVAYLPGAGRAGAWIAARTPMHLEPDGRLRIDATPPIVVALAHEGAEASLRVGDAAGPTTEDGRARLDAAMTIVREGAAAEPSGFVAPPHRFEVRASAEAEPGRPAPLAPTPPLAPTSAPVVAPPEGSE